MTVRSLRFSPRQVDVVRLIAAGNTDKEVAEQLGIGARTVKAHSDAIRDKLSLGHRREIPRAFMDATGIDPFPRLKG